MKRGPAYNMRSKDGGGLFVFQLNGHHGRWSFFFARMAGLAVEVLEGHDCPCRQRLSSPNTIKLWTERGKSVYCCSQCLDCGFLFILI